MKTLNTKQLTQQTMEEMCNSVKLGARLRVNSNDSLTNSYTEKLNRLMDED